MPVTTDKKTAIRAAEKARDKLEQLSISSLPKEYQSFKDFLYDFYPDLPWDVTGMLFSMEFLLSDKKTLEIANVLAKQYKVDLIGEWEAIAKEANKSLGIK